MKIASEDEPGRLIEPNELSRWERVSKDSESEPLAEGWAATSVVESLPVDDLEAAITIGSFDDVDPAATAIGRAGGFCGAPKEPVPLLKAAKPPKPPVAVEVLEFPRWVFCQCIRTARLLYTKRGRTKGRFSKRGDCGIKNRILEITNRRVSSGDRGVLPVVERRR